MPLNLANGQSLFHSLFPPLPVRIECTQTGPYANTHVEKNRGFKALKQSTKILFLELHRPEEALKTYEELLPYTKVSHMRPDSQPRDFQRMSCADCMDMIGFAEHRDEERL